MKKKSEVEIKSEGAGFFAKAIFIVLLLCSLHFWNLKLFPPLGNVYNFLVYIPCGLAVIMVWRRKEVGFKFPVILFLFGLMANFVASAVNLNQSIYESFFSFSFYYFILIYFLLHYLKISRKYIENTVIVFSILYALIFIVQYKVYPASIFNSSVQTAKGERQFEILGHGFLMLGYFLVLNRFVTNRKLFYIGIAMILLLVQFKCGFRTLIAGSIFVSGIMVMRMIRFDPRDMALLFVVLLLAVGLSQYRGVTYVIEKMVEKTETNLKQGDKYVRNIEMEYFYKVYPRNMSYYLIGGGKPAGRNLYEFDYEMANSRLNFNIVWVDIGLLGFYIVVGGIALMGMLWWVLKAVFMKMPRDKFYLKFYFLYLLIVSFTNEEIFRNGIFTVQAIALYLIDFQGTDENNKILTNNAKRLPSTNEQSK